MALTVKPISSLLTDVRHTLQDTSGKRWTDLEMFTYIDKAVRDIAKKTKYLHIVQDITVTEGVDTYNLSHQMIKLHSVTTVQDYTIDDATSITIEDAQDEDITVDYYAYPPRVVYGTTTNLTLEEDMYDWIELYVLYKCYQKEDSTELQQKAMGFLGLYKSELAENLTRWHGFLDVTLSKNDFYS